MKKKQGSAMVLAVLMLAFFMTLSLNMYFLAENKAKRAQSRSEFISVVGDIDSSSTLGYYELYLASEYIIKGFITSPDVVTTRVGIAIPSYIEYFSSYVSGDLEYNPGASITASAILTAGTGINDREWSVVPENLKELWYSGSQKSIGGYSFDKLEDLGTGSIYDSDDFSDASNFAYQLIPAGSTNASIVSNYSKDITFPEDTALNILKNQFEIIVERRTDIKSSGSAFEIVLDRINSIEVINKGNN